MSAQLQIRRRCLSVLSGLDLEFDRLPIAELGQSRLLYGRDVDKHVLGTVIGRNKPVAFLHVEPFHRSGRHLQIPHQFAAFAQDYTNPSASTFSRILTLYGEGADE